jgi:hypothetical protein
VAEGRFAKDRDRDMRENTVGGMGEIRRVKAESSLD